MQAAIDVGYPVGLEHRIVRHLASGGMAHVYLAEHVRHGGYAAVKFIEPRRGVPSGFLQHEAKLLASIHHANIVRAIEHGRMCDGRHYLLLEYIHGVDLAEWITLAQPRLSRARWLRVLMQLAAAVDHIHAHGIVHGDIKPANVMFDPNAGDAVKLVDFGLAFELQHTASGIGGTGTPGYMAPEQERGAACAPATDRFALALVAYELLTGRALQPPASGERELRPASGVYLEHVRGHGQRPKFESVFTRALHLNPHARFDSARAFVEALAALASPQSSDTEGVPLCAGC